MSKTVPKSAWVPNGVDPTELDYPLERPTVAGCGWKIGQVMIVILALYGGLQLYLSSQSRTAAATPKPTATALPAIIIMASPTPAPTQTPLIITATLSEGFANNPTLPTPLIVVVTSTPGATLAPSITPTSTYTATPPGSQATWTPGAWMVTRWAATVEANR